jgi:hypothetical protein
MAIVQISRIQVRRGLHHDLPQLASGEFGWSIGPTSPRLWIGNGTLEEGAPVEGVTEILTEHSNFLSSHTFAGTDTGYTSQTGVNSLNPTIRTLQSIFDERVSVKDFGANGDGVADDTAAINRCIQQIYVASFNETNYNRVQRKINFPAGTYNISGSILIPPNCQLIGDGKNNTIINASTGTAFLTCDSLFQTGAYLGTNSSILPHYIVVNDMTIKTASTSNPAVYVDSATQVTFNEVIFSGGSYNLTLVGVVGTTDKIVLSECHFTGATTGTISTADNVTGLVTRSNYFDTVRLPVVGNTSSTVTTVATGAGEMEYQISSGSNYRIGRLIYNNNGTASYDDEFTEPATSLGANLYVYANGTITCTTTSDSVIKYNIKQFI